MLDRPGRRYVVVLAGCPLRYLYCLTHATACLTEKPLSDAGKIPGEIKAKLPFLRRGRRRDH